MRALVVCKHPEESKEASACRLIKKKGLETIYSWKNTFSKKDLNNIDLVIAIGGDGTILSASHYLLDCPLLAVNLSPETSEGALATLSILQLDKKLDEILNNKHTTENLERIQILINSSILPLLALNEVFIANEKAYLVSKYKIKFKDKEEIHKSSGIIASTGTGSTAWFKSANGLPFSQQSKFIRFIIREPFIRNISLPSMLNGQINEKESLALSPLVPSILSIDSIREFSIKPGDKITLTISPNPLRRIK